MKMIDYHYQEVLKYKGILTKISVSRFPDIFLETSQKMRNFISSIYYLFLLDILKFYKLREFSSKDSSLDDLTEISFETTSFLKQNLNNLKLSNFKKKLFFIFQEILWQEKSKDIDTFLFFEFTRLTYLNDLFKSNNSCKGKRSNENNVIISVDNLSNTPDFQKKYTQFRKGETENKYNMFQYVLNLYEKEKYCLEYQLQITNKGTFYFPPAELSSDKKKLRANSQGKEIIIEK